MKFIHVLSVCILVIAGIFCVNSIGHTQSPGQIQRSASDVFSYATLRTETIEAEENLSEYRLVWNNGINDIIGRSSRSLTDARRKLNSQLGGSNAARTNLSVLLSTVGRDGWRLIETNEAENETTRIFIRRTN